ncbi:IS4/Tn5 family transposase DNA-binding protein [Paraburkholderia youngii]|uniref:IS4/Tn5 family transposase DNA-binding protein n=1 Tax=Paraburkholderia youngii TaxID=2782701 RepID=UPI003D1CA096
MTGKRRADDRSWLDLEVQGSEFQDTRLRRRFAILLGKLWDGMGQTIPFACQDWASTKAAYRFLSNDRVGEHDILSGHFQASAERVKATDGLFSYLNRTSGSSPKNHNRSHQKIA